MQITILPYTDENAIEIADLHHAAVHAIRPSIYSKKQQEAWAHTPPNYPYWKKRLALKKPFVAVFEESIVGFIELEADGHIDCAYTHPDYQKRGVMTKLYTYIEALAHLKGIKRLYVEASLVSKPFFKKQGFVILHHNVLTRNGCLLMNSTMEKTFN